ncbi:hypothetical protein [Streptomyces sp. NPDC054838]
MNSEQSGIPGRGRDLSLQVRNRSVEHNLSHDRYRRRSRLVSLAGAALAAVAGASLLTGLTGAGAIVVGVMGLLSAVLAAVELVLGYAKQAEAHRVAGSSFGALGTSYYNLQFLPGADQLDALQELTHQQGLLARESVNVEQWAIEKREKRESRRRELEQRQREGKGKQQDGAGGAATA